MSKLELVFTADDGTVLKSAIAESERKMVLDYALNTDAQIHLDNFADMISDYDMGDGDRITLCYEPQDDEHAEYEADDYKIGIVK